MKDNLQQAIKESIQSEIVVEGPIEVTEKSHPFSSMAYAREPLDLSEYGYIEEEYFLSGTANVYEETKDSMAIKNERLTYKNRILVRKPEGKSKFSGRVFIDIYNASNGYDIEDVWRRSYEYYMTNGDIYIGITSKPINVLSLKNFDYDRYHSLNWSAAESVAQPTTINPNMSIPGTEEGLFWDMLSQLAFTVRENRATFLEGYAVDYLYLTGQSQSGMYLNTYTYYFDSYVQDSKGQPLFDGYLNVVGAGIMRSLNQETGETKPFAVRPQRIQPLNVPIITVTAQGDFELFEVFDLNTADLVEKNKEDKTRLYEVASAPHTDPASPLIPNNEEIVKTNHPPKILDGEYNYEVNDIQLAYYVNSALEMLHQWVANSQLPAGSLLIERDESGHVIYDEHGNGMGGMRSPYIDVPLATYHPNAKADKEEVDQSVGNVNGSMEYFSKEKLQNLYGTQKNYLEKFNRAIDRQVGKEFLLPLDAKKMKKWAEKNINRNWSV